VFRPGPGGPDTYRDHLLYRPALIERLLSLELDFWSVGSALEGVDLRDLRRVSDAEGFELVVREWRSVFLRVRRYGETFGLWVWVWV